MTVSVDRRGRQRLAKHEEYIKEFPPLIEGVVMDGVWITRRVTVKQLHQVADVLDGLANFWLENPNRWCRGQALKGTTQETAKMCNIGALYAAMGEYDSLNYAPDFKGSKIVPTFGTKKAITTTRALTGYIVEINDQARSVNENVEGLRLAANAYRAFAELPVQERTQDTWAETVHEAFKPNARLLKVQQQRFKAKRAQAKAQALQVQFA
jgi:hypothetical protein